MSDEGGGLEAPASKPLEEEGAPTWVVTFGDLMSLLLTFFILMYSMSELKVDRFLVASQSLREAMGSTGEVDPLDPQGLLSPRPEPEDSTQAGAASGPEPEPRPDPPAGGTSPEGADGYIEVFTEAYMAMLVERLSELLAAHGLDERSVEIVTLDDGVYLRIRDAALFRSGDAQLAPEGQTIVKSLSGVTGSLDIPTVVSGHADDRPIATDRYPSNWELSAARAAGVARFLVANGQSPSMVKVESYGEYAPVGDNGTEEGRAKNRRVELFFSREEIRRAASRLAEAGVGLDGEDDVPPGDTVTGSGPPGPS